MTLPFSPEQFFGVFADYNRTLFWMVLLLWLAALASVRIAWRGRGGSGRLLTWYLAVLWLWNAIAYHALLFSRINPAAWLFAALFALQAILFAPAAAKDRLIYFVTGGWRQRIGALLVLYAFLYPVLNITIGHGYPVAPTFGVPCPTAILTIGLLLTTRGSSRRWLLIIPVLWGVVASSAVFVFGVWTDSVLIAAAAVVTLDGVTFRRRFASLSNAHRR